MNKYSTPIKALKIERQKWHQGMILARKGKYALSEKELKLYVDEYNACDEAIDILQGEVIAEGEVMLDVAKIGELSFSTLMNRINKYLRLHDGQKMRILISKGE